MDQIDPNPSNLFDLQLDQTASSYLGEAGRWARFLSILGFIMCGLLVLVGIFMATFISGAFSGLGAGSAMGGTLVTVIYMLIALLYFFPCLYLFHFGFKMKSALQNNDQVLLSTALKNLKSCFKFFGILFIIALVFYALALIAGILGAAVGH